MLETIRILLYSCFFDLIIQDAGIGCQSKNQRLGIQTLVLQKCSVISKALHRLCKYRLRRQSG